MTAKDTLDYFMKQNILSLMACGLEHVRCRECACFRYCIRTTSLEEFNSGAFVNGRIAYLKKLVEDECNE
jgi:hypothetical protein